MSAFLPIVPDAGAPEEGAPDPARVLRGAPRFRTWTLEDRRGLYAGIWESTPGAWRVAYDEWEYCRILSGVSILTEDGQPPREVRAGDAFVLRPGFTGIWEVVETTRKDFVILT